MVIEKRYMEEALKEALLARASGETPVGAVVVRGEEIISRAHNEVEECRDPSRHAELLALYRAAKILGSRCLSDCVLYVTMEPCPMCAGACLNFRVGAVAFGAFDKVCGALGSKLDLLSGEYGREIPTVGGIMREECASLLQDFFEGIRNGI